MNPRLVSSLLIIVFVSMVNATCKCNNDCGMHTGPVVPAFTVTSVKDGKALSYRKDIIFEKIVTNIGNGYDARTGKFTAPKNGLYQISATMMSLADHAIYAQLFRNQEMIVTLHCGKGHNTCTANAALEMKQGDQVSIVNISKGPLYNNHTKHIMFSGFLIQAL